VRAMLAGACARRKQASPLVEPIKEPTAVRPGIGIRASAVEAIAQRSSRVLTMPGEPKAEDERHTPVFCSVCRADWSQRCAMSQQQHAPLRNHGPGPSRAATIAGCRSVCQKEPP
jgi:hypothetical protein